jgi:hypothetical protein
MLRPCITAVLLLPALAAAQVPEALSIRQQHVQRLMDELEHKFLTLKLRLSQTEPDRAERLQQALNRAKELLLQQRMADVAQQLEKAQLDAADENQKTLLADLHTLLGVLTAERRDPSSMADENQSLQKWQAELQKLATAEQSLLSQTEKLTSQSPSSEYNRLATDQNQLAKQASETLSRRPQAVQQSTDQVAAAHESMQQASQSLSSQNAAAARQQQSSAIQQLLDAIKEVEQRSRELAQQAQSETLARLAAHFRQMLDRQRQLTTRTSEMQTKRSESKSELTRADRLAIRAIGETERHTEPPAGDQQPALAYQAQQALDLLADERSDLLKQLIQQLKSDLILVGGKLAEDLDTGRRTTSLQREIETTLEQLTEAIAQAQKAPPETQPSENADNAAASQRQQALLPTSAELKLLRAGQLQINRRTEAIDEIRQSISSATLQSEIEDLAQRQAALSTVAESIIARQSQSQP